MTAAAFGPRLSEADLLGELRQLRAQRDAVLELHYAYRSSWTDEFDICPECSGSFGPIRFPCQTAQALGVEA